MWVRFQGVEHNRCRRCAQLWAQYPAGVEQLFRVKPSANPRSRRLGRAFTAVVYQSR